MLAVLDFLLQLAVFPLLHCSLFFCNCSLCISSCNCSLYTLSCDYSLHLLFSNQSMLSFLQLVCCGSFSTTARCTSFLCHFSLYTFFSLRLLCFLSCNSWLCIHFYENDRYFILQLFAVGKMAANARFNFFWNYSLYIISCDCSLNILSCNSSWHLQFCYCLVYFFLQLLAKTLFCKCSLSMYFSATARCI